MLEDRVAVELCVKAARGDACTERENVVLEATEEADDVEVVCNSVKPERGDSCGVRVFMTVVVELPAAADEGFTDGPNPVLLLTAVTISSDGIGTKILPALGRLKSTSRKETKRRKEKK